MKCSIRCMLLSLSILTLWTIGCKKDIDESEGFIAMKKMVRINNPDFLISNFTVKKDEGFLVSGYLESYSVGLSQSSVINMKPDGEIKWTIEFLVDTFKQSAATYCIEKAGGGYYVSGIAYSSRDEFYRYLAILDDHGNLLSHHIYDVPDGFGTWFSKIILRHDGNLYLVNNYTSNDFYVPDKLETDVLDAAGNILQSHVYDNFRTHVDQVLLQENDELLISGTANPGVIDGSPDFKLMRLDKDGNIIINKVFGTAVNWETGDFCIPEAGDGYVFSGTVAQSYDCALYRMDNLGEPAEPVYLYQRSLYTEKNRIYKTSTQGYLVMSTTYHDFVFARLNENLSLEWKTSLVRRQALPYGHEYTCSLQPAGNNRFVFIYQSDTYLIVVKTKGI